MFSQKMYYIFLHSSFNYTHLPTADTIGTIAGLTAFGAVVAHGGVTLAKHKYDTIQLEKKMIAEQEAKKAASEQTNNEGGNH